MHQASSVQCIGMAKPIPIRDVYQPARLVNRALDAYQDLDSLIGRSSDPSLSSGAIIFAGPGWGKTTLLHWIFMSLVDRNDTLPILFTLRLPDSATDLIELVDHLASDAGARHARTARFVLLVDGYDEIAEAERARVSTALMLFAGMNIGHFILTCRSHYSVANLKAQHLELEGFTREHTLGFITSFSRSYGKPVDAAVVLGELEEHNLNDFASHPLMLALVCILKTSPNPEIPRRAIGLIERALDTLTFKWDQAKMIHRPSVIPLDGRERLTMLMRIAFEMKDLQAPQASVEKSVRNQLALQQLRGVDSRLLLQELAQWYGILIPVDEDRWTFVHRTIHDFLGARFWVETGSFATSTVRDWDLRSAYAACLLPDATNSLVRMLGESPDLVAFSECLYNGAPFAPELVAKALLARAGRRNAANVIDDPHEGVLVRVDEDYCRFASFDLLREFVVAGSSLGTDIGNAVALLALAALFERRLGLSLKFAFRFLQVLWARDRNCWIRINADHGRSRFRLSDVLCD